MSAIRNMTVQRILHALDGVDQLHATIERNEVTVQVMDGDRVDYEATEAQAKEVQEALGEGWTWSSNGSLVRLCYDPDGSLGRARESVLMDQLGPAYEPA